MLQAYACFIIKYLTYSVRTEQGQKHKGNKCQNSSSVTLVLCIFSLEELLRCFFSFIFISSFKKKVSATEYDVKIGMHFNWMTNS